MDRFVNTACTTISTMVDFDTAKPGWVAVNGEVFAEIGRLKMSAMLNDYAMRFAWGARPVIQSYTAQFALLWVDSQDVLVWLREYVEAIPRSIAAAETAKQMLERQRKEANEQSERKWQEECTLRNQRLYWLSRQQPYVVYNPDYEKLDYEVHLVRPGQGATIICECHTKEDAVYVAKALYAASVVANDGVEYVFEPEYVED